MTGNRGFVLVIGFVAFVINPSFACSSSGLSATGEPQYQYGESEMTAAVQGNWRLTVTRPEGDGTIDFTVTPGPRTASPLNALPGRMPLCGNREFIRPAASCIDASTLYVAGTILAATTAIDTTTISGSFQVNGLVYSGGFLSLLIGANLVVSAEIDKSNAVTMTYTDDHGARVPSKLDRMK